MVKELFIVIGVPYSGRSTWINKNLLKMDDMDDTKLDNEAHNMRIE
jgi:predicted kinase